MSKARILDEAGDLVHGPRQATYGHPFDDFTRVGRIWGAILGVPDIAPATVALMLAGLKLSRESQEHKRDNLVDLAGYAETAALVREREVQADHTRGFDGLAVRLEVKPGACARSGKPHEGPHDPECWAVKPWPPPGDYSRPKP